ncbi:mechanosensitive ion channel, partial [Candidatus Uhrbacteria bacterium]|nr:mechanosensitive ion channel [Candidatus Uhrbacteria bacterium]
WYEVRKVGLRSTKLFRLKDAALVSIPNNKLANEMIANFVNKDDRGRWMRTYGVGYGSDVKKVKQIILGVINDNPSIVKDASNPDQMPIVRFDEMGDSSLNFYVMVWLDDRANRFKVTDYMNTEIYQRLTAAGIEIPFPARTVYLRTEKPLDVSMTGAKEGGGKAASK